MLDAIITLSHKNCQRLDSNCRYLVSKVDPCDHCAKATIALCNSLWKSRLNPGLGLITSRRPSC